MMTSVHVTCIIRCPHLYQKQQSPQAPSRRPCTAARASQIPTRLGSTYGHTPDAFPHTFWQIPIGRPSPHTIYKLFKIGFSFDETSGSCPTNPNQPCQQTSRTCVTIQQTKRRPSPANATDLRLGGAPSPPVRKAMVIYSWARARPWSCAHGHSHARP